MAGKKKRKKLNKLYMALAVAFLGLAVVVQIGRLYQREQGYKDKEAAYEEEIKVQEERAKELALAESQIQTKEFVEDTAKKKLGMVHENEIVFREK